MDELVNVTCGVCGGDGYTLEPLTDLADETLTPCEVCGGTGELEVCGGCLAVPEVVAGFEVCACLGVSLKRAA